MSRAKVLLGAESFETVNEDKVSQKTREKSDTEDGVYIRGLALPFGEVSRNGVQYDADSVRQTHEQLEGRTMLFNHKQDWATGHILNTEVTEDGLYYEGDINPNAEMPNGVTVAEAIERGDISSVSIQAFVEEMDEEADEDGIVPDMATVKVRVRDWIEISAVTTPGFQSADAIPEHMRSQGVEAVTEAFGVTETEEKEQSEETENEEEQDSDKQDVKKEEFEFRPLPTHVLYDEAEDARQRAKNLGLGGIHEHEMAGQIFYMAGENHDEWLDAADRMDSKENLSKVEKAKQKAKEIRAVNEALSDVDLTPPENVKNAAQAALDFEEENEDIQDCGTGVGDSRANSITNETLSPEDFLGGENTAIPDYLESHEEDVTAEGAPTDWSDEEMNDCGNRQYAKWGYDLEWFKNKEEELQEAKEEALNNVSSMTEESEESGNEENVKTEEFEQLMAGDLYELVAGMHPEVEQGDVSELLGEFDFDFNVNPLVDMVAKAVDEEVETVMEAMADLADGEMPEEYDKDKDKDDGDEAGGMDDDDEDEEEEGLDKEELKEKVDTLEERLDAILENDKENSGTGSENTENKGGSTPSFKGLLD